MLATMHWAPKRAGAVAQYPGMAHRRGVEPHLVGTGAQRGGHVVHGPDAATDRERNEQPLGGAAREGEKGRALLGARRDVEEDDLVGAVGFVARRQFDGIADVTQSLELHALHHAPSLDIQADDQSPREHQPLSMATGPWC